MKVVITGFIDTMTTPQRTAGFVYIPFHVFLIPLFIEMLAQYLPTGLGEITQNIIYYSIALLFCIIVMWKYLRSSYDVLIDNFAKNIIAFIFAYIIFNLLRYLTDALLFIIMGDNITSYNEAIMELAGKSPQAVIGLTIFIAPLVDEILFRGVVFGSIQTKHRRLAYVVSIALFAFYNVWQYAFALMDWRMLIFMVKFIPSGYALAWIYEKTNCIWMSIFLNMAINLVFLF